MNLNLQHEDLLIRLRAKLNEDKIKLWEPPYYDINSEISPNLQKLAEKYATSISMKADVVLQALKELQLHSLERSKANAEFKESGVATIRIKATVPGEKARVIDVQKKLSSTGKELFEAVSSSIGIDEIRLKLIFNGKILKLEPTLEKQGVKNGSQVMALIMSETPDEMKKEDSLYLELKATKDDATLLSEYVNDMSDDDEYMKLEDQSGKEVEVPKQTRRALMVGLALHARGRTALNHRHYPLAILHLIEADEHFSECSWSLLQQVDNWAVLQLDIAWCYLCLQNVSSASDVAVRLQRAEESFRRSYGENMERLIALKGTASNERVLLMRLYLLQGIVAFHQNKRDEARALLERAENELNGLRVEPAAVTALLELGWAEGAARQALRAACDVTAAHHLLQRTKDEQKQARSQHRQRRKRRLLGLCMDGSLVDETLVQGLMDMGFSNSISIVALRNTNNHVAEAVRLIQESPEVLINSDSESSDNSEDVQLEPDVKLIGELEAMGYDKEQATLALRLSNNHISGAIDILSEDPPKPQDGAENPSTSTGRMKDDMSHKKNKRKVERDRALARLSAAIRGSETDQNMDLVEEEEYLVQYKSLL